MLRNNVRSHVQYIVMFDEISLVLCVAGGVTTMLLYYLPGTAEGGVAHDDGLGGEGDPGPGAEVDGGHQAGETSHQVNNSAASIVHGAQLVQPTIGGPVMSAITVREY